MAGDQADDGVTLGADGQLWIEILSWDWNLAVALSSDLTPVEYRFQGGLNYSRSFELLGRIVAPRSHADETIRIWISPFDDDMRFGPDEMDEVGRLYLSPSPNNRADRAARLMLPADAVAPLGTSLSTVSKYLLIRIFDCRDAEASIDLYSFSSALPEHLRNTAAGADS